MATAIAAPAPLELFLDTADLGLRGALCGCFMAPEVRQLAWASGRVCSAIAHPDAGVCCPHLRPRTALALAAALAHCDAPQLRTLRPAGDFDSSAFLPELASRLSAFGGLEDLGPLSIDASGGPLLLLPLQRSSGGDEESSGEGSGDVRTVGPRSLLPALAEGFGRCRQLLSLDLTVRCLDLADAHTTAEVLLPALGECRALRSLRLDLDASKACGGPLAAGVAAMLERLSSWHRLERLSLGYVWWTQASDNTLERIRTGLRAFGGSIRALALRYSQDPELGALDAACATLEGAASGLEEVCIMEGWGDDGTGLPALADAVGACGRLRRVDLLGVLPPSFDRRGFVAAVRAAARAERLLDSERPPAVVGFNASAGWQRAGAAAAPGL